MEFDIKGLFDNIDYTLLMKAVRKHTDNKWVILYIDRWLKTPMQLPDGSLMEKTKGTMQGGVISPVLSNLFLHYVFDAWMSKEYKSTSWCRYADDGLVHCKTEQEAKQILARLNARFKACGLELHPDKTKIIYCKDDKRKGDYSEIQFDFLGYTFRGRTVENRKTKARFVGFTPAVSKKALSSMRAKTRERRFGKRTDLELEDIAQMYNPVLSGWINYYGRYHRTALYPVLKHFNRTLITWARRKYKNLNGSRTNAGKFLEKILKKEPDLFEHWKLGITGVFG